jgi:hypothetical protein
VKLADLDNGLLLEQSCIDFRVHDAAFSKFSNAAVTVRGIASRGVIYSFIQTISFPITKFATTPWLRPSAPGTLA